MEYKGQTFYYYHYYVNYDIYKGLADGLLRLLLHLRYTLIVIYQNITIKIGYIYNPN
jgi:hypothetical protein